MQFFDKREREKMHKTQKSQHPRKVKNSPWHEKFGGREAAAKFLAPRRHVMPFLGCYAFCIFAFVARATGKIVTPFFKMLRLLHPTVQNSFWS